MQLIIVNLRVFEKELQVLEKNLILKQLDQHFLKVFYVKQSDVTTRIVDRTRLVNAGQGVHALVDRVFMFVLVQNVNVKNQRVDQQQ